MNDINFLYEFSKTLSDYKQNLKACEHIEHKIKSRQPALVERVFILSKKLQPYFTAYKSLMDDDDRSNTNYVQIKADSPYVGFDGLFEFNFNNHVFELGRIGVSPQTHIKYYTKDNSITVSYHSVTEDNYCYKELKKGQVIFDDMSPKDLTKTYHTLDYAINHFDIISAALQKELSSLVNAAKRNTERKISELNKYANFVGATK